MGAVTTKWGWRMTESFLPATALASGWSIIPTKSDKKPIASWKLYQTRPPTEVEFRAWEHERPAAWAVVTGAVSRRITFDFDGEAGIATMRSLNIEPHRRTPSGGYHADFGYPGWPVQTL